MLLAYDGLQAYSITLQVPFCNSICIEPYVLLTSLPLPATILLPHQRQKQYLAGSPIPTKTHAQVKTGILSDMMRVLPRRLASQARSRCSSGLKDSCVSGASAILNAGWPGYRKPLCCRRRGPSKTMPSI